MKLLVALVAIDCPDPHALADFYRRLLDVPVTRDDKDWVEIGTGDVKVAFQEAPDHQPPTWPNPEYPQQMHLDIQMGSRSDFDAANTIALALGARRLTWNTQHEKDSTDFEVYANPAGHPFCFIWS